MVDDLWANMQKLKVGAAIAQAQAQAQGQAHRDAFWLRASTGELQGSWRRATVCGSLS